jgi:hypothetical protein
VEEDNQAPQQPLAQSSNPIQTPPPPETPKQKFKLPVLILVILGILVFAGGVGAAYFFVIQPKEIACTMEAKLCSDGSSVGRTGPNCEFAPCPTGSKPSPTPDPTADWKTYGGSGFSFKYPSDNLSVEERESNYFALKPIGEISGFAGLFIDARNDRNRNKEVIESIKGDLVDPVSTTLPNGEKISGVYGPPKEQGISLEGTKLLAAIIHGSNLSIYFSSADESSFKYFDQILSTFKFTDQN